MTILTTMLIVALPSLLGFGNRATSLNKRATTLYKKNKYDEALEQFRKAQVQSPDSDILRYNIGCTLYKKGEYDEAEKEFADVASSLKAKKLWAKAYYNFGNTLFRNGKLNDAIESYKRALRLNPNDMDAKYNLEFAQNILQQSKEQQQKQQDQQKEEQEQQQEREQPEEQQPQPQQQEERELTKEDIERILSAAREEEKKTKQESEKQKGAGQVRVFKDW